MTDREAQRACNRLIMNLNAFRPMDAAEKKADLIYGFYLAFSFISPIFVFPWLFTVGKYALGIGIVAVIYALALGIGLSKRRSIIRSFYTVPDAESLVELVAADETYLSAEGRTQPVLMFRGEPYPRFLALIYNWMVNRSVIECGSPLVIRLVDGGAQVENTFMLIDCEQLQIDEEKSARFLDEVPLMRGRWV